MAQNTLDAGGQGANLDLTNTGTTGDAFTAISSVAPTYDAASAFHGAFGALTTATAADGYLRVALSTSAIAARLYFKIVGTVPTTDTYLFRVHVSTARYVSVHINSVGKLRVTNAAGTTVWTAATALSAGVWYRLEMLAISGSTTSNGTIMVDYYLGDDTTPKETGYSSTAANAGAAVTYTNLYMGKYGAVAFQFAEDSPGWLPGASAYIGPYAPAATSLVKPLSVLSNAGSVAVTGSSTIPQALSDASDSTYVINPDSTSNEAMVYRWAPLLQNSTTGATFRWALDTGSANLDVKMEILQGATVVATRTVTLTSATPADYTVDVTGTHKVADITWISGQAELWGRVTWRAA